ncbi:protein-glutamine gamma-glutamyltransferase [Halobacillus andaensis]|uniref:protein-glutamine gamma-glutamyltransferase n=1 Tax=Halobacillus andaensis TaxID=1176239 RepID=UPI003D73B3B4
MIQIGGRLVEQDEINAANSEEEMIVGIMSSSQNVYAFHSMDALKFELRVRRSILRSAELMNQSEVKFATFDTTRSDPRYWIVTNYGAIRLRPGVKPSAAIQDIYSNSREYAFECAGAMLIIYYHAVLNVIGESAFNFLFPDIYIYSWHADSDLGLYPVYTRRFLPGDIVYFDNPDFDPQAPQWRGENAVFLGNDLYFGHGLGILSSEQMVITLNELRRPDAGRSSYLTNLVVRLNYTHLQQFAGSGRAYPRRKNQPALILHNENSIPYERYRYYMNKIFKRI